MPDGDRWIVAFEPGVPEAFRRLLLDARDQIALREAFDAAEEALAADPAEVGESRVPEGLVGPAGFDARIAFFPPLTVRFHADRASHVVTITHLSRTRPGPAGRRGVRPTTSSSR